MKRFILNYIFFTLLASCSNYNHFQGGSIVSRQIVPTNTDNVNKQFVPEDNLLAGDPGQQEEDCIYLPYNKPVDKISHDTNKNSNTSLTGKTNREQLCIEAYSEENTNDNYEQLTEVAAARKKKIEPMGLTGSILSLLSLVSITLLLSILLVGGGSAFSLLIISICVAFAGFILGLISFFITKKKPGLYRLNWFSKVAMYLSGLAVGIGLVVIPIASIIITFKELFKL